MTPHSTSLKSTFLILFISTAIFSACKKDVDLESAAYVNETTTVLQDNDGLADQSSILIHSIQIVMVMVFLMEWT
ncbi:hypothetical protein ACU8V7_25020 [Zobellia nedashkovskayae]